MINIGEIRERMKVVDQRGNHVGTVDHLNGLDEIKLTKTDSPDGVHHYIPIEWVERIDVQVHLSKTTSEIMRVYH